MVDISDFAQRIRSIAPGDKLTSLIDDLSVSRDDLRNIINKFASTVPTDKQALVNKSIDEWFIARDTSIKDLVNTQLRDLTKKLGDSDIGDVFKSKVLFDSDGNLLGDGTRIAQILSGARELRPLQAITNKAGGLDAAPAIQYSDEVVTNYQNILSGTAIGQKFTNTYNRIAQIQNEFRTAGLKLNAPASALTPELQALKTEHKELQKLLKSDELQQYKAIAAHPSSYDAETVKGYGLTKKSLQELESSINLPDTPSVKQIYDMTLGQFVDKPIAVLGDFLRRKVGSLKYGNDSLIAEGRQLLATNVRDKVHSDAFPETSLESQVRWVSAPQFTSKKSGGILTFNDGTFNPYKLAAALHKGLPIKVGDNIVPTEVAYQQLAKGKIDLYKYALSKGMSEPEARLYADLPQTGKITSDLSLTKPYENNFLNRRNVIVHFDAATPITEMELKSVGAIRTLIDSQQANIAENSVQLLQGLGVAVPEAVTETTKSLRKWAQNGDTPIDFAHAANATIGTTASGRMLVMNTQVQAFQTWLGNALTQLRTRINTELNPLRQAILKGTAKDADLDLVRTIQAKVQGGGNKWFDASAYGLSETPGTMFISKDVVGALQKEGADVSELLTSPNHMFEIANPNVSALLSKYLTLEGSIRDAAMRSLAAKGYSIATHYPGELYFPPTDVVRSPYFVMVRDSGGR